jgi:hypothetical protein
MPTPNDVLRDRLSRSSELDITVTGRNTLYLLPVKGSDTQWYKNVLKKPTIRIKAGGAEAELKVVPVTDAAKVSSVVEKFRGKYGANDVKKYYSKLDVAVVAQFD